jgi:DNA-binding CsgD family transcriptional regulator
MSRAAELAATTARVAAELAIEQGRLADARAAVREGLARPNDARLEAALVAAGVAAEAVRGGSAAAVGELLERLDRLGTGADLPMARALTQTARAEATRLGEPSVDAWRRAAATWEALPCPWRAGWARLREAEALLAGGAARADAAVPLHAAASAARSTGALRLLHAAERVAGRARIDVGAAPEPAGGLTPREREVLVHLAAGRTNRQIADALYISPRTAGVHVSRILAKLGASTRGEAAAAGRLAGVIDEERVGALLTRSAG